MLPQHYEPIFFCNIYNKSNFKTKALCRITHVQPQAKSQYPQKDQQLEPIWNFPTAHAHQRPAQVILRNLGLQWLITHLVQNI